VAGPAEGGQHLLVARSTSRISQFMPSMKNHECGRIDRIGATYS
jgi:hypothetical protein